MRIAIDLTPLYGRKRTGVEMYAIDLYRALLTTKHTVIPIFHAKNELDDNPHAYVIPQTNRLILENIKLSTSVRKIKPDIVCFPIFPPPVDLYIGFKGKIMPTLHDFAFLKYKYTLNAAAKYYLTPKMRLAFKKADGFITISETVKNLLERYTRKPIYNLGENIAASFMGAKEKANPAYLEEWELKENRYFISVSTIEPRKNFKYLLQVLAPMLKERDMKLVLVGRKGWGKDGTLKQLMESMNEYLVFTEYVPEEILFSLYRYAYAFALLSLDEGFGRTPFEAVACGCRRIVLSDIPIFHETFEGNATFVPLDDADEAGNILSQELKCVSNSFEIPFHVMEKRIEMIF